MTTHLQPVDAHVHVFAPEKFCYSAPRSYTPGEANVAKLRDHIERIGAQHVVIVQPSPYGTDNRATLDAVEQLGQKNARAIAVVDPAAQDPDLIQTLWNSGVRGLRANLKTSGQTAVETSKEQLKLLTAQMAGTDMALQVFLPATVLIALKDTLRDIGRPIILDHFAGLKIGSPDFDTTFEQLLDILALPNVILKTSGLCRAIDYADTPDAIVPLIPALFDAAKDRVIWGSDWPHTGKSSERAARPLTEIEPFMDIDDVQQLQNIKNWSRSDAEFHKITRETSLELFGF